MVHSRDSELFINTNSPCHAGMRAHVSVAFFMQVEVVWCKGSTYQSPFQAAWVCDLTVQSHPET